MNFSYSGTDNLIASDGTATYSWDPSGDLVGVRQSGSSGVLAFTDEHTDVVGEFTGSATNLAGSTSYDPFGKVVAGTGMAGRLGYQSGWTDPTTSQVDMAARWYDPSVGQFHNADTVSQDPVPDSVAANPFAYANDDPLDMTDPTGHWPHWAKSLYRGAKHAAHKVGHAIVHAVTHPVQTLSHAADDVMRAGQRAYHAYVAPVVKKVTHAAKVSWHAVRDGYHRTVHAYKRASHAVAKAVKPYVRASVHAVKTAYHKSAAAVKTAAKYVQHHAAAIASFVVSTAVFIGCEAAVGSASGGVGAVATVTVCGALAGEVGGAVSAGVKAVKTGHFSLSDFGREVAFGGLSGAAAGLLGAGAGKLLSPVAGKLTGVLGNLLRSGGGEAATQAAERAAGDAAASGLREAASEAGGNAAENVTSGAARDAGEDSAAQATRSAGREPAADAGGAPDRPAGSDGGPSASREPEHPSSEPSGCSVHSFDPATSVLMADATHKPIKDIKVGDKVLATDPTTGKTTPEPVLATHDNHDTDLADVTIQDAAGHTTTLHTTWHHPFYNPTAHTFTDAADLAQGTPLQTTPDTPTTAHVVSVRTWTAPHDMRDLTIANVHTYYVLTPTTPVLVLQP